MQSIEDVQQEICVNLWYVCDQDGVVYSLRGRAYLLSGTDEAKLAQLQQSSLVDYLIANPYPVPSEWHTTIAGRRMAVALLPAVEASGGPRVLFNGVIQDLHEALPAQTELDIPEQPLVCITALVADHTGRIAPAIHGTTRVSTRQNFRQGFGA